MSWGTQRRKLVLSVFFLLVGIPLAVGVFILFYDKPSCTDGKQNGEETGVDCGGVCTRVCSQEAIQPIVLWERFFKTSDGFHTVIAYIENPNPTAMIPNTKYVFRLYDNKNALIVERHGTTNLSSKSILPIVENNLETFERLPVRVEFDFTEPLVFEKQKSQSPVILIKNEQIQDLSTSPRVTAQVQNISLQPVFDVDVVVIVYDLLENVLGVSSTFVPSLSPEEQKSVVFTWPTSFTGSVSRIEIIPIYENN